MATSLGQLGARMQRTANRIPQAVNVYVRQVGLAIYGEVAVATPVDTGTARSNFTVTFNFPDSETHAAFAPGKDGSTAAQNVRAAIETARAALSDRQPGQTIYIVNNLPYIPRLNEGWSPQANSGYIARAVAAGLRQASTARLNIHGNGTR